MKQLFPFLLLLFPLILTAQPDLDSLQQEWIQNLKSGDPVSSFYWDDRNLIYSKVKTTDSEGIAQLFGSEGISELNIYRQTNTFQHDTYRYVTVGTLTTDTDSLLLLTGWRDVEGSWKKEIDIILNFGSITGSLQESIVLTLDQRREDWVKLANQHDPEAHIHALYDEEATYFASGRPSNGRNEITERYAYMENPNYQVDLEKRQLWRISEERILELGRYFTGSERIGNGGIYIILWEQKPPSKEWMIALDFNF